MKVRVWTRQVFSLELTESNEILQLALIQCSALSLAYLHPWLARMAEYAHPKDGLALAKMVH